MLWETGSFDPQNGAGIAGRDIPSGQLPVREIKDFN